MIFDESMKNSNHPDEEDMSAGKMYSTVPINEIFNEGHFNFNVSINC